MEFYERVSGARMHAAFYRPNDVDWTGLNHQFFLDVALFSRDCFKSLTEIYAVLSTNTIWKTRLVGVGSINIHDTAAYSISGPVIRSVGLKKDMRFCRLETYGSYWYLSLHSFLGKRGDSYDRFLIRVREMYESVNIVLQILTIITSKQSVVTETHDSSIDSFLFYNFLYKLHKSKISKNTKYIGMETMIHHFKTYSSGLHVPRGFAYAAVEAPKGELGVSLVSDGTSKPYRCKIRTPAYHHMHLLTRMVQGHYMADLVTVLGSLDIVFGDVDR